MITKRFCSKRESVMNVNISNSLLEEMKKNYVSAEYIIGETLPMISSISLKKIPPFFVNDDTEMYDFSDTLLNEVRAVFPEQWEIENCIQFLLAWGIMMEV